MKFLSTYSKEKCSPFLPIQVLNVFRSHFIVTPQLYGKKSKFLKTAHTVRIILQHFRLGDRFNKNTVDLKLYCDILQSFGKTTLRSMQMELLRGIPRTWMFANFKKVKNLIYNFNKSSKKTFKEIHFLVKLKPYSMQLY